MPRIRYYDDSELEGLTDEQLDHLRLVVRVLDLEEFAYADATQIEQLTDEHLREILNDVAPPVAPVKPPLVATPKERKKRESSKPAPPITIAPKSIEDAFVLVNGQLMRRRVAIVESVRKDKTRYTREVEHFTPCGGRVRFGGRVYSAAIVAHYLQTGEIVDRVPRAKSAPRFKAQIRIGAKVLHLGYYSSKEERDTAVGLARLGIFPNGLK